MPVASWLFLKDNSSIWIERPYGRAMVVAGPGTSREEHEFPSEEALDQFQMKLAERLVNEGWFLWAYDRDRRSGHERRSSERGGPDRRTGGRGTGANRQKPSTV